MCNVSNIPNAHTKIIVHPTIPTNPISVLVLFLKTSLKFHLLANFIFLNIPFEVIFKLLLFTFGISSRNVSAGDSFNSLLHVKYVTKDITKTIIAATKKLLLSTAAFPFGIWKYSISIPINTLPISNGAAIKPIIAENSDIQNP